MAHLRPGKTRQGEPCWLVLGHGGHLLGTLHRNARECWEAIALDGTSYRAPTRASAAKRIRIHVAKRGHP